MGNLGLKPRIEEGSAFRHIRCLLFDDNKKIIIKKEKDNAELVDVTHLHIASFTRAENQTVDGTVLRFESVLFPRGPSFYQASAGTSCRGVKIKQVSAKKSC